MEYLSPACVRRILIDLFLISQEILPAGIHFLVLLLVNKLSNLDQRRDFLHLYAISLIALLASAALTTQIWYAPFFFIYLVIGVWTLLLYHLLQEREELIEPEPGHAHAEPSPVPFPASRPVFLDHERHGGERVWSHVAVLFLIPRGQ